MSVIFAILLYLALLVLLFLARPELVLASRNSWQRSIGLPYAVVILAIIAYFISLVLNKIF